MTIEEINQITDISERVKELKKRSTNEPDTQDNLKDWDFEKHDVFNTEIRKKRKVLVTEAVLNVDGSVKFPARYKDEDVNRIALPLEQDIVNIHTAFTVGKEPTLKCDTEDEQEQTFLEIVKNIYKRNKLKYSNKKIVRSWLSECEVAEYWYTVEDSGWWLRVLKFLNLSAQPKRKLKSTIWSPFRNDKLFPYFDGFGDLIAFSREYKVKDAKGNDVVKLMTIDDKNVTIYIENKIEKTFAHGFGKMPVMYMYREKPYAYKIKTIRNRLEVLLSNFADCLDYNFYPKLVSVGDLEGIQNRGTTSEIIELADGGQVSYLTWDQSPDMAKLEFDNLTEKAYHLTNTPLISFEKLQGMSNAPSGKSFEFMFMGTHMAVSNHAEVVEEFLQRRVNFLVSAIGTLYPKMKTVSESIMIDTEIVPYSIDNQTEKIQDAVTAVSGGVASLKTGIVLAGLTDKFEEELKEIEEAQNKSLFEPTGI
ncbi:phage portal protein [Polaribacter sp. IC073]|uniref:phage portal protein n=1 Tax=Polaribacter sp. IC073 TaxID=2508540 RepID=UPI001CB8AED6|nr:phage portal protein [Polaribacter sp. IC073]